MCSLSQKVASLPTTPSTGFNSWEGQSCVFGYVKGKSYILKLHLNFVRIIRAMIVFFTNRIINVL